MFLCNRHSDVDINVDQKSSLHEDDVDVTSELGLS